MFPIMKEEDGSRAQAEQAQGPKASVEYFVREGSPADAVVRYLLTLIPTLRSSRASENKTADCREFPFFAQKNEPVRRSF